MVKMKFHTEERDRVRKIIEEYGCSPFDGKCHVEEVTFYQDKKTKLYHILLAPQTVEKFDLFGDEYINEQVKVHPFADKAVSMSMLMIKPTTYDNNYIIFRRK